MTDPHRIPNVLVRVAIVKELVHGDESVSVEVHGVEDAIHVAARVEVRRRVRRAHQFVDRFGHLRKKVKEIKDRTFMLSKLNCVCTGVLR